MCVSSAAHGICRRSRFTRAGGKVDCQYTHNAHRGPSLDAMTRSLEIQISGAGLVGTAAHLIVLYHSAAREPEFRLAGCAIARLLFDVPVESLRRSRHDRKKVRGVQLAEGRTEGDANRVATGQGIGHPWYSCPMEAPPDRLPDIPVREPEPAPPTEHEPEEDPAPWERRTASPRLRPCRGGAGSSRYSRSQKNEAIER
jgi:hypothetical protein